MLPASSEGRSLELFVRSLSPAAGTAAEHVRRLRGLESRDAIEDTAVHVWGREVGLSRTARRTGAGQFVLDRVAAFRSWADEYGVSIEPFFGTREINSSITGERFAALTLPVCCLAEYDDDGLCHVAPHRTDRAVCAVGDRLGSLEGVGPGGDRPAATLRTVRQ